MFQMKANVDFSAIRLSRTLAQAAPGKMGDYVAATVRPASIQQVNQTFAIYPGPVMRPFVFASALSRRWFFANFPSGSTRNGYLAESWEVQFDRRANDGFLVIRNTANEAIYTFGNRQVQGHANTGWGTNFDRYNQDVSQLVSDLLVQGWIMIAGQVQ